MKFFKHFTDAHRGKSMQSLLEKMGHRGHSVWWLLVEICAEKLEEHRDEEFTEEHCRFAFNARFLYRALHLHSTTVEPVLNQLSTLGLLAFTVVEDEFNIHIPKLLECLDRDSRRARPGRVLAAPKIKKKIKNKEEEREVALTLPPLMTLWNFHLGEKLGVVKKTNASRSKKSALRFGELTEPEWVAVLKKIGDSDFCCGKNDRGWQASFDWLLQPETHLKVSEGKYDNRDQGSNAKPDLSGLGFDDDEEGK